MTLKTILVTIFVLVGVSYPLYKLIELFRNEARRKADVRKEREQKEHLEKYVPAQLHVTLWDFYRSSDGKVSLTDSERNLLLHLYGYQRLAWTIKAIEVGECVFFMHEEHWDGQYPVAHIARFEERYLKDISRAPHWWQDVEKYKIPVYADYC